MMKHLLFIPLFALSLTAARAQKEVVLPVPDAKMLGMGGVTMTAISGSHSIYGNPAMAAFALMPSQISSSYFRVGEDNYYAVTGYCKVNHVNVLQLGWRQYLRERGNNDMAVDIGYSRRIDSRWSAGVAARYLRLKRPDATADALAVDLAAGWALPLEAMGEFASLRAGAKIGNLGGCFQDKDFVLPMDVMAGAALDVFLSDAHEITAGVDFGYCFAPARIRGCSFSVGAEYNLMQLILFRAGYHYGERSDCSPSYGSLGAGVRFLHLRFDFACLFARKNTLFRNAYSFSFGLDF